MNSQVIEVVHFEEGKQSLVGVPLAGSKLRAILLKSDFHDLMSLGVSTAGWKLPQASSGQEQPLVRLCWTYDQGR
jgi:hypothetical protein